jgi:phosphorylated CTD-interacting factor 1
VIVSSPDLEFQSSPSSPPANPPFSEELMIAMVEHLENVLSESEDALSFIIFIPEVSSMIRRTLNR